MSETSDRTEEGLRERKRRETARRITDAALRLFIAQGYEATTLDAIAAEAGISRRTFFAYFSSKDEILLSAQSGMGDALAAALRQEPAGLRPLQAARNAVLKASAAYPADDMVVLDRLMRSNPAVQARKQASYVQHEETFFQALRERWPEPAREAGLRLVAMATIGAIRLSINAWSQGGCSRPLAEILEESFDALEKEV